MTPWQRTESLTNSDAFNLDEKGKTNAFISPMFVQCTFEAQIPANRYNQPSHFPSPGHFFYHWSNKHTFRSKCITLVKSYKHGLETGVANFILVSINFVPFNKWLGEVRAEFRVTFILSGTNSSQVIKMYPVINFLYGLQYEM